MIKTTPLYCLFFVLFSCNSQEENTQEEKIIEKITFNSSYKFDKEIEEDLEKMSGDWKYQISADQFAMKGDYKNALKEWDLAFDPTPLSFSQEALDSFAMQYKAVSAIDYIDEASKSNQIIIINEEHHNPKHRVFTKSLLQKLYNNGYTFLGLETLNAKDTLLNNRKYPTKNTGTYSSNPQYGDMVREALEIGFTLFAYEVKSHKIDGKKREVIQAQNIERVMEANPSAKFLIHCGYSHVYEGKLEDWEKSMAGRLAEYTGINPFTIDQTGFSEKSNPENNHPYLKLLQPKEPIVLIDTNNNPFKIEEIYGDNNYWADIAIFHPTTEYISERPDWLFNKEYKNVQIKLEDIEINFPVMIMAFKEGEDINNAIPIDIIEIENKEKSASLALKKGDYTIVVLNQKEDAFKYNLTVD